MTLEEKLYNDVVADDGLVIRKRTGSYQRALLLEKQGLVTISRPGNVLNDWVRVVAVPESRR